MSFHAVLDSFFLNPVGLLALLALLPLIAIYLMRPEPDERVMPSMEFFMEEKRSGRMRKALQTLQRNLVLLLHILFIGVVAAALAGPYMMGEETPEQTVVVVDRSASMADDLEDVQDFVEEHAGRTNTLVLAGEDVAVPLEGADRQQVLDRVAQVEARDVETDIRGALQVASGYEGTVAVASDLDQTVGEGSGSDAVEQLAASGRDVAVMETAAGNQWGIVNVDADRGNSSVDVKNFMDTEAEVQLTSGRNERELVIPAGSVETVTVATPEGRTSVRLEEDPVPADNAAYVSVPERRSFDILLVSDTGNQYFETAVDLINFTSIETVSPPLNQVPEADVYVIGESDRLLRSTVNEVEDRVRDGAAAVFFAQDTVFQYASSLPVERTGARRNVTVEIEQPRRVLVGETGVFPVRRTGGESLATEDALVRAEHGSGDVVLYNIRDRDFHFDFLYPVFWKALLMDLTERPTVEDRNLRTGEELDASSVTTPSGEAVDGPLRMTAAGFYETPQKTVAANLESMDESGEEVPAVDEAVADGENTTEKPLKPFLTALLLVLAVGEFGYLRWRGTV